MGAVVGIPSSLIGEIFGDFVFALYLSPFSIFHGCCSIAMGGMRDGRKVVRLNNYVMEGVEGPHDSGQIEVYP